MTGNASGRGWAYLGLGLGLVVSECANVAHSYVPPAEAGVDWSPAPGAVVGALFWPAALFVAIEILARVRCPQAAWWQRLRWVGLVPVATVAAVVSYRHMSGLLAHYGEDAWTAHLGPLAVDGLMVMATAALLATSGTRHTAHGTREEHVTADVPEPPAVTVAAHVPELPAAPERHTPTGPPRLTAVKSPARRTARPSGTRHTDAERLAAAHTVAAALKADGRAVGRRNLAEGIRALGISCSAARADELLAELTANTAQEA